MNIIKIDADALVLKAKIKGPQGAYTVNFQVHNLNDFVHASPNDWIAVTHGEALFAMQKRDLEDIEIEEF